MSAEFTLYFFDLSWYFINKDNIINAITSLPTYSKNEGGVYYLSYNEGQWEYCVRFFIQNSSFLIEISSQPITIKKDLIFLFGWIRNQTKISIYDDDGEESCW